MWQDAPLFPESASTISAAVDRLYFALIAIAAFFALLIATLIVVFAVRYRRRPEVGARPVHGSTLLELLWSGIPLAITLVLFVWGARLYFQGLEPPSDAMDVYATGKQWMWKLQHEGGQREINDLHVPVGTPVRLTMTSEDVIHSFFVPAFRIKRDVLPGRYTIAWFEATEVGTYHLFCAEYCGTKHSQMIGTVHAMEPHDYEQWLTGAVAGEPPEEAGRKLYEALRCDTCHNAGAEARGPVLAGRFGQRVPLADGRTAVFDEGYIRESILTPLARLSAGYGAVMPTYAGQVNEDQILQLIAYIKSLQAPPKSP
jgi:cytochrome c oxidase subunit 2